MISLHFAAARMHWLLDTGGATPMLKGRSLFEGCVTVPVGSWSVVRKKSNSQRCHVRNLTNLSFERKKTKFVCNKTSIYFWDFVGLVPNHLADERYRLVQDRQKLKRRLFSFSDRSCWELIITTTSHGTSRFVSERRFGMGCPSHLQVCYRFKKPTVFIV